MLRPLAVLTGLAATVLTVPTVADAATRWGSDPGPATPDAIVCATSCTVAQERYANQALQDVLGDPPRGVVTGWRVTGAAGQARLRVVGGTGATAWVPLTESGAHAAQLPVGAGQLIGLDLSAGARVGFSPPLFPSDADVVRTWAPALAEGAGVAGGTSREGGIALELDVEPDADGDGLGDETQDPDGGRPVVPDGQAPPGGGGGGVVGGGGGGTPKAGTGGTGGGKQAGPKVPRSGPRITLPRAATATSKGVVTVSLVNGYGQALRGRLTVRAGKRTVGSAAVKLPADGSRDVALRLSKAAKATLKRKRKLRLTVSVKLRGPAGASRTTKRTLTAKLSAKAGGTTGGTKGGKGGTDGTKGGTDGGGQAPGFDGTYRASDGQTMVVEGGKVVSFSGSLTLYCTRSGQQKNASYSMVGDDPRPTVATDGSFAWEATAGYGFQKLKFDGAIKGDAASGKLMVEDRSPLLGTGKFEFDYCFAGKEWSLSR